MRRILATTVAFGVAVTLAPASAFAHRSGCHRAHSCPSDHATYSWHGKLCAKPGAREQTRAFRHRVRYGGLTYYCK